MSKHDELDKYCDKYCALKEKIDKVKKELKPSETDFKSQKDNIQDYMKKKNLDRYVYNGVVFENKPKKMPKKIDKDLIKSTLIAGGMAEDEAKRHANEIEDAKESGDDVRFYLKTK